MEIFHGSSEVVVNPAIREGRFAKDFGEGFYCTILQEQAERWAKRKTPSVVNIYDYVLTGELKVMEFAQMTDEWLDFIVDCRRGISHDFDIVVGAMANDQIFNYINDFVDGMLTREQFWVLAKFKRPTHQICFCSEEALKSITFKESYIVK